MLQLSKNGRGERVNIREATLKAAEIGGLIVRPQWKGFVHIKPTDGPDCCIPYGKGQQPGKRWNPCAEDLVAEDWEVTTEELS